MESMGSPTGSGLPSGASSLSGSPGGNASGLGSPPSGGGSLGFGGKGDAPHQQQLRYFAAGICGLMAVFIVTHWLRVLLVNLSPYSHNPIREISRMVRNLLVRKMPGFTSTGHFVVVSAYVAINAAVLFTNVDIDLGMHGLAPRCGWLIVANFTVVVFLSLKNTPLAILSAYSYERLNGLHQISGYTTFVYVVLHGAFYTKSFLSFGAAGIFTEPQIIAGIVAGFGFLFVILSGMIVRFVWYEVFFAVHVLGFLMALIGASYHVTKPITNGLLIMLLIIASMWFLDRVIRGSRMLFRSFNNYATIEPLPQGGTKIILAKRPAAAIPGKHCFLWIPSIRAFESHPFTIAATEPMEFVVKSYDGFTRDLHKRAVANPGVRLKASVDGPYGTFPDPMAFDKVVLIAAGSGATFTFGLAVNMLERMGPDSTNSIVFIWAVREHENLSWFESHLKTLHSHPSASKVSTSLHVTSTSFKPSTAEKEEIADEERRLRGTDSPSSDGRRDDTITFNNNNNNAGATDTEDPEKAAAGTQVQPISSSRRMASYDTLNSFHGHDLKPGRPDTATLIRDAVSTTPGHGRVLVAACGPDKLMRTVRDTTASLIRGDGPGVELHCEQFGW